MDKYSDIIWNPREIELESMRQVAEHISGLQLTEKEKTVVGRIIHTAGDPSLAQLVHFHPQAVELGVAALKRGASVYTDVTMLAAGINNGRLGALGGEVRCSLNEPGIAETAKLRSITRAAVAMEKIAPDLSGQLVAIGNAPTALFRLLQLMEQGIKPALIIGMPVGFVGAAHSKELLTKSSLPYITILGNRGGSPLAAATVNALLGLCQN